mgnify:FL=1
MNIKKIIPAIFLGALLASCGKSDPIPMFVGTYTDSGSDGIYSFSFDQESGKAKAQHSAKVSNPSYLVIAPNDSFMYCVSENKGDEAIISAYRVGMTSGRMALLNRVLAHGDDPCHLATYARNLYVANYSSGSISVVGIERDATLFDNERTIKFNNGTNADPERQSGSHIHQVQKSPNGKYLFAVDLGGDCIYKYELRPKFKEGEPFKTDLPQGCGPRHITFSPDSKHAYVITELSDEVIAFDYDAESGNLVQKQAVKASDAGARGGAEIEISPDGKFLYASVRLKNDGVAIFQINPDGTLKKTGYQKTGRHPRMFKISPNGKFLLVACKDDNVIQVYERNAETGRLTNTGNDIRLSHPACIVFGEAVPW